MLRVRTATVASAAALIGALFLTGCPFVDYFPRRQLSGISASEVVGRWKLTQSAPPAASPDDSQVEFLASGECRLQKLVHGDDVTSGTFKWRLDTEHDSKASLLVIGAPDAPDHRLITSFYFTRKHRQLTLWQYVGDPDNRDYIEYQRI